jgi:RHS repeat-associated protein
MGEKFSPDLHTGTGTFTVPIVLPAGRNGFQPQLNLVYSTGNGNGPFGHGWSLSIPGVSRKTAKGIPLYDDTSDAFVLSGAEDLVPVEQKDGTTRYQPRTEGLFARILHHREAENDYWEVRSKDGLTSFYGTPRPSHAAGDWTDPAVIRDPDPLKPHRIAAWKLTRTLDPFGNHIDYRYERDAVQTEAPHRWDQLRLSEIGYVDFADAASPRFLVTVELSYEDRPDPFSDYRAGFEIRTVKRCTSIQIFTHPDNDIKTRSYRLTYLDQRDLPENQLPLNRMSLLSRIQAVGHDGALSELLPPLGFGYTRFEPGRRRFFPVGGAELPGSSLANPALEQAGLFGNGLPDILELNGTVRYWRNLGNGTFDRPREMRDAPAGLQLADPGVQLVDADGDGRVDLLVTTGTVAGYFPLRFGGTWDRRSFKRYKTAPSFNLEDPEVKLVDLDGDGVTDAIRSGTHLECFFNDPEQGWTRTKSVERRALDVFPNVNFSDPRVKWGDMSGDGLQDIVLVHDGSVDYWPNLGYGNWGPRIRMRNSPRLPDGYNPRRILVGDVDGDGLADIVYVDNKRVTLWINQSGNAWSDPILINGTPLVSDMDAVRLTDLLGNGVAGVLWSADFTGLPRKTMFFLDLTGGIKPYLLDQIDNNIGAVTRITYASSTQFYLADQKKLGTRWRTPLPFPVQVVARVEAIDDLSQGRLTTEYRYHHGYWDGVEREFRGFGMVEQFDSEGFTFQGAGAEGGSYRFTTIDAPGAISTYLRNINNAGQIVGQVLDANHALHGLFTDTRSFTTFDPHGFPITPFPGTSSANGINDLGEIVGTVVKQEDKNLRGLAYLKRKDEFEIYEDPAVDSSVGGTEFEGINNVGIQVGSFADKSNTQHGIIRLGTVTTLLENTVEMPANTGAFIFDINNLGQMVGGYFDTTTTGMQHGFFADPGQKLFVTIDPPGSSATWLDGINDFRQMVGGYFDDRSQRWRGFLTDGMAFTALDFPDAPETFLGGIDNSGRIVGYYGDLNRLNRPGVHGFLATPVSDNGALRLSNGRQHFSPPTCTKTWFHQGAVEDESGNFGELDFGAEFWSGDTDFLDHKQGIKAFLRSLADRRTRRDALRALRGSILRIELYALDGTERADRPYTVTEHSYGLRQEASAAGAGGPAVFFPHCVGRRTSQWERGDDPLTTVTFTDTQDYDAFGQVRRSTQVACPRGWRRPDDLPNAAYLATRTLTTYATPADAAAAYIANRVARSTQYELANSGRMTLDDLYRLPDDSASLSLIGQTYNYYDGLAFQGLPFGQVGAFGALARTEVFVLTEQLLRDAYKSGDTVLDPPEEPPYLTLASTIPWTADYPREFREQSPTLGGYVFHAGGPDGEDARGYFARTDARRYDFQSSGPAGSAARGLVLERLDPLGHDTQIIYDDFALLPRKVIDPAHLITEAIYDYRVLQPKQAIDVNGNQSLFTFTPLGLLSATFIRGKPGETVGDQQQPSVRLTYDFLAFVNSKQSDPGNPQPIFVHTVRRCHHDSESDVALPMRDDIIERREYSDGFGRLLQTRTQAEDLVFGDPVLGDTVLPADQSDVAGTSADVTGRRRGPGDPPNVAVSGWQVYDNKGRVVEKYEPFFAQGFEYAAPVDRQFGQRLEMFYDPRGQLIRSVYPNLAEQRVIFGVPGTLAAPDFGSPDTFEPTPWEAYTYDPNDNAGRTHPAGSMAFRHHWDTPASIVIDALGRTIVSVERNRDPPQTPDGPLPPIEEIRTRTTYDIRGNLLTLTDALGRQALAHLYDLANRRLRSESIDAGLRRSVLDAAGNLIERRAGKGASVVDTKGALVLSAYDQLNRLTHLWARDLASEPVTLRERVVYGDDPASGLTAQQLAAGNLLGKPIRHYDEAGLLSLTAYDFKRSLLDKQRKVIDATQILSVFFGPRAGAIVKAYRVDWAPDGVSSPAALEARARVLLDPQIYQTSSAFDALNRFKSARYPQDVGGTRKELRPTYNRAGALERVDLDGETYVERIAYTAKGQRALIAYGNGVMTRYAYDDRTFRLSRLRTEPFTAPTPETHRPAGTALQDFAYACDLVGNIATIHDRTPESGIPNTVLGSDALDRAFGYDALYRLISASGRECDHPPDIPWDDAPRCTDLTKTRAYLQRYTYDSVGNIRQLRHVADEGGFTREFTHGAAGTTPDSNRLQQMSIGADIYAYTYDDCGNVTDETLSRHFEWDHSDRMRAFRAQAPNAAPTMYAHYLYDAGGRRTMKLVRPSSGPIEVTVYIDGAYEHRMQRSGAVLAENNSVHVMDNQSRVALVRVGRSFAGDSTPPVAYQLADHLGSSNVVVGGPDPSAQEVINREEYAPYGEATFGSFRLKRYRFTGKERDEESSLYYFGARYFAPWLGRWISPDPSMIHGSGARSDAYIYVGGRALNLVDAKGLNGTAAAILEGVATIGQGAAETAGPSAAGGPGLAILATVTYLVAVISLKYGQGDTTQHPVAPASRVQPPMPPPPAMHRRADAPAAPSIHATPANPPLRSTPDVTPAGPPIVPPTHVTPAAPASTGTVDATPADRPSTATTHTTPAVPVAGPVALEKINDRFMEEQRQKIVADPKNHPLGFLLDPTTGKWISRSHKSEFGVQAGHLESEWFRKVQGIDEKRMRFAVEGAWENQYTNWFGETGRKASNVKEAIEIGGVPVETETAKRWVKEGKGNLTIEQIRNAPKHEGWRP